MCRFTAGTSSTCSSHSALGAARSVIEVTAAGVNPPAHPLRITACSGGGATRAAPARNAWIASHFHQRAARTTFARLSSNTDESPRRHGDTEDDTEEDEEGDSACFFCALLPSPWLPLRVSVPPW